MQVLCSSESSLTPSFPLPFQNKIKKNASLFKMTKLVTEVGEQTSGSLAAHGHYPPNGIYTSAMLLFIHSCNFYTTHLANCYSGCTTRVKTQL